jgi:hypothetical protein
MLCNRLYLIIGRYELSFMEKCCILRVLSNCFDLVSKTARNTVCFVSFMCFGTCVSEQECFGPRVFRNKSVSVHMSRTVYYYVFRDIVFRTMCFGTLCFGQSVSGQCVSAHCVSDHVSRTKQFSV